MRVYASVCILLLVVAVVMVVCVGMHAVCIYWCSARCAHVCMSMWRVYLSISGYAACVRVRGGGGGG